VLCTIVRSIHILLIHNSCLRDLAGVVILTRIWSTTCGTRSMQLSAYCICEDNIEMDYEETGTGIWLEFNWLGIGSNDGFTFQGEWHFVFYKLLCVFSLDKRRVASEDIGLENREDGRGDPLRWLRDTLYPQTLALTSPTSGCRSVGVKLSFWIYALFGGSYLAMKE
jgi:hypothetical protein